MKYQKTAQVVLKTVKQHWPIFLIIIVATWLRVWRLNTHLILFGDAARDILVAQQSLQDYQLPLLGIPSSIPRFHQGPLSIWLSMSVYLLGGNLTAIGLVFALLSILAVIAAYELVSSFVTQRAGLVVASLISLSPLAVAHGRTPYHTTPIPLLLLIYLWTLLRFWHGKKLGIFWSTLAWAVLFQFELALLPLILLIPVTWWHQDKKITASKVGQGLAGLTIGLSPQLLYDATHSFQQLGGFALWVVYRIVSFFGYSSAHVLSAEKIQNVLSQFWLFGGRIFSIDQPSITLLFLLALTASLIVIFRQWQLRTLPPLLFLASLATVLQVIAYLVHGAPGEAYFPPFILLLPMLIGYGLTQVSSPRYWKLVVTLVCAWALFTATSIVKTNFFVSTRQAFSYGPSVAEQRAVLTYIDEEITDSFSIKSTSEAARFDTYFANFKLVAKEMNIQIEEAASDQVFIEQTNTIQSGYTYPQTTPKIFPSVIVYAN